MPQVREDVRRGRRKEKLRRYVISCAYAFAFPFVFVMIFSRGQWDFALVVGLVGGIVGGGGIELLVSQVRQTVRRWKFVPAILLQTVAFAGVLGIGMYLSIVVASSFVRGESLSDPELWRGSWQFMGSPTMLTAMVYAALSLVAVNFVLMVSQKLGPGVLGNILRGKYHHPSSEERVFMFLDMKDSTTLAEELGDLKFSQLVQAAFADIDDAMIATKAEVSHYIGDEIVLSWQLKNGLKKGNPVRFFQIFLETLDSKSDDYIARFGLVPTFKAGIHVGKVVAAEVGVAKTEIVFHGDVMNTTARIQGLCSELQSDLIVSSKLVERMEHPPEWQWKNLGEYELKGKSETVGVCVLINQKNIGRQWQENLHSQPIIHDEVVQERQK